MGRGLVADVVFDGETVTGSAGVEDLVLTPPPTAVKPNRHVQIAINHMELQHEKLTLKIDQLTKERDDLETALKALR